MDINKVHKVLDKLNSRKMSSIIFSFVDQNPSHRVQNTFQQKNYLQDTITEVKSSHLGLRQGKRHKPNIYNNQMCEDTILSKIKKNALNPFFGDEQEGFPGGFPVKKGCRRAPRGLWPALPLCRCLCWGGCRDGPTIPTACLPLPGTALLVFKRWEVARS